MSRGALHTDRDAFTDLIQQLARRSPVHIDGVPHAVWIIDIRFDPRTRGSLLDVKVAAKNPSGRHYIGRFQLEAERLQEEGAARAIAVMERVIRGNLPPTAGNVWL